MAGKGDRLARTGSSLSSPRTPKRPPCSPLIPAVCSCGWYWRPYRDNPQPCRRSAWSSRLERLARRCDQAARRAAGTRARPVGPFRRASLTRNGTTSGGGSAGAARWAHGGLGRPGTVRVLSSESRVSPRGAVAARHREITEFERTRPMKADHGQVAGCNLSSAEQAQTVQARQRDRMKTGRTRKTGGTARSNAYKAALEEILTRTDHSRTVGAGRGLGTVVPRFSSGIVVPPPPPPPAP